MGALCASSQSVDCASHAQLRLSDAPWKRTAPSLEGRRLNTHLSSIVSTSFEMPTEVLAEGPRQ